MFTKTVPGISNTNTAIELEGMICPCCNQPIGVEKYRFAGDTPEMSPFIAKLITNVNSKLNGRQLIGYHEFVDIVMRTRITKDDIPEIIKYLSNQNILCRCNGNTIHIF